MGNFEKSRFIHKSGQKTFSRNLSNEKSLRRRFRKKRKLPTWWKKEESSSWNRPKFLFKKVQIYFKDNRLLCRSLLLFSNAMTAIKDQIKFFISWRYKFCFLCVQKLVVGVWWVSEPTSIFCPKLLSLLLLLLSSLKFNQNLGPEFFSPIDASGEISKVGSWRHLVAKKI